MLIVAGKADNNFNAIITPYDVKADGSYAEHLQRMRHLAYSSLKDALPHAHIDTAPSKVAIVTTTSKTTINGVVFDKFVATIRINGAVASTVVALSKLYKGYDFGITYSYYDDKVREQMEAMLRTSTFTK